MSDGEICNTIPIPFVPEDNSRHLMYSQHHILTAVTTSTFRAIYIYIYQVAQRARQIPFKAHPACPASPDEKAISSARIHRRKIRGIHPDQSMIKPRHVHSQCAQSVIRSWSDARASPPRRHGSFGAGACSRRVVLGIQDAVRVGRWVRRVTA